MMDCFNKQVWKFKIAMSPECYVVLNCSGFSGPTRSSQKLEAGLCAEAQYLIFVPKHISVLSESNPGRENLVK